MKLNDNVLKWINKLCYAIIILSVLQAVAFKGLINEKILLVLLTLSLIWLLVVECLIKRRR